jgi:hypothetical protein
MLRQMRAWWWTRCAKADANPEVLALNRQIAELRLDQARGFTELKELVVAREQRTLEEILRAQTLEQLSAASGVSLPPQGTVFVFEPPPAALDEDREIDRRILASVESGDRSLSALKNEFGEQRVVDGVERLSQQGLLKARQSYRNDRAVWVPVQVTAEGREFLRRGGDGRWAWLVRPCCGE